MTDSNDTPEHAALPSDVASPATGTSAPIFLSREDILGARDLRFEIVKTDEWRPGSVVRVVALSAAARDTLEDFLIESKKSGKTENIRAFFASLCVVDENDVPLFTREDVDALGRKSAVPIGRIFDAAHRLNDVSDKAIEEAAGNSGSGGSDTSSSPSL